MEKEVQRVKTENRKPAKPSTRRVDCQTELTWLDRDNPQRSGRVKSPVAAPASNTTTTVNQQCSETQTDQSPNHQSLTQSPNRNATVGSQSKPKKKHQTDRQPKGSCDTIAQANKYLRLLDDPGDVEMAEAAPQRGPSPVVPTQ